MLRVGLTGGIGSGKSTVAGRLAELGAVVTDADVVARRVVEPGQPALTAIRERFGAAVIRADGTLDRAGLAALVFPDPEALAALNAITGPAIVERVLADRSAVPDGTVSVFDMPLLVERRGWVHEHVSVVVETALEARIERLVTQRGLDEQDVRNRIAAQASDAERRAACDVVLDNSGARPDLVAAVDRLWHERLAPWNDNLVEGRRTRRAGQVALRDHDPAWPASGARVVARLTAALAVDGAGLPVTEVTHIGSTSVPDLPAKDVIDIQVGTRSLSDADAPAFREAMRRAGYVCVEENTGDTPHPDGADPSGWSKRFYGGTDPAEIVHVHVREHGSAGWEFALAFPDWLRTVPEARHEYAAVKRTLASRGRDAAAYADLKEPWFATAYPRVLAWARTSGWRAP